MGLGHDGRPGCDASTSSTSPVSATYHTDSTSSGRAVREYPNWCGPDGSTRTSAPLRSSSSMIPPSRPDPMVSPRSQPGPDPRVDLQLAAARAARERPVSNDRHSARRGDIHGQGDAGPHDRDDEEDGTGPAHPCDAKQPQPPGDDDRRRQQQQRGPRDTPSTQDRGLEGRSCSSTPRKRPYIPIATRCNSPGTGASGPGQARPGHATTAATGNSSHPNDDSSSPPSMGEAGSAPPSQTGSPLKLLANSRNDDSRP